MTGSDTIFALSSGAPPAAIAIVRLSGPDARRAAQALAGTLPPERQLTVRLLRDADGGALDRAMVYWAAAPATATGEDIAELHLHGGRAVVAGVLRELATIPGLRQAEPGEFTRRAFLSGRIDLAEAEALADLLTAETEYQRKIALGRAGGAFGRLVERWRRELLSLAAHVEARLEFGEEEQLGVPLPRAGISALAEDMAQALATPPAERLGDGIHVVIAGPPNAGKSTLLNALAGRDAAIVSPIPGTTRDVIEAPVAIGGLPFLLADTAGLRVTQDEIEALGVDRARCRLAEADILIWLGDPAETPPHALAITVQTKVDLAPEPNGADLRVAPLTGHGLQALTDALITRAQSLLPQESDIVLNERQRKAISRGAVALTIAWSEDDEVIVAEHLRTALASMDRAVGRTDTENMLDALFRGFCIGK